MKLPLTEAEQQWLQRLTVPAVPAAREPKGRAVFREVTEDERRGLEAMKGVSFGMNAFANSFRRNLREGQITDGQARILWMLLKRYRRQTQGIRDLLEKYDPA